MPPFVLSSSSAQARINKHYELALRLARRRLWSRGWSAQDVEDAAADAIIAVRLMPDSTSSDEEVLEVIGKAVDGFRARERRVRVRQIHFDEPGAFARGPRHLRLHVGRRGVGQAEQQGCAACSYVGLRSIGVTAFFVCCPGSVLWP